MPKRISTRYNGVFYRLTIRLGSQTQKEKSFYIRYRLGGRGSKLIEEPVGLESEGMTAAKANGIRSDRARGKELSNRAERKLKAEKLKEAKESPYISRLWGEYNEYRPDRRVIKTDKSFYRNYLEEYFADKTPDEITTKDIDRLKNQISKRLKPQTVKYIMALLRRIIRFGVSRGLCSQPDPSKQHFNFPLVDNIKTECLTQNQIRKLLQVLDEEPNQNSASFMRLALFTGMRKGALMALKWEDIDFNQGFITLDGGSAKKAKTERIPMSSPAREVLKSVDKTDSPYVFPGKNGKKRKDFKRVAQRVRDKAGLPKDFRPLHGLRHTFASMMASSGKVDLYTLQKLLTHSSPEMTQRYAHLADEALQRAADVAGDVFKDALEKE